MGVPDHGHILKREGALSLCGTGNTCPRWVARSSSTRGFIRIRDLVCGLLQEYMEDYIQQFIPRNRVVHHWFDVYDLEEERI